MKASLFDSRGLKSAVALSLSLLSLSVRCLGIYDAGRVLGPLPITPSQWGPSIWPRHPAAAAGPFNTSNSSTSDTLSVRLVKMVPPNDNGLITNAGVGAAWCLVQDRFCRLSKNLHTQHTACYLGNYLWMLSFPDSSGLQLSSYNVVGGNDQWFFSVSLPSHLKCEKKKSI